MSSLRDEPIEGRLIFVISPPRSGSTMLMRMLASHSEIFSRPEPHLFGPLAHLGYYDTVEKAPYDQLQAAQASRELVAELPRGEDDYLDACRAYVDVLYGRLLAARGGGKRYFVDKTPANALVLPFLTKLMPAAKYVVLTRHPAAIFRSYADSFFDGDYAAAQRFNPILSRYIPVMAELLRERRVPLTQVVYEDLVRQPEREMERVCEFLGVPFEPGMVEYGGHAFEAGGLGDPTNVGRQTRPVAADADRWVAEFAADAGKREIVDSMLAAVDDRDLEVWGARRADLWAPLAGAAGVTPRSTPVKWDRFLLQRKLLVWLRRDIHRRPLGRLVRRVRDLCDVLLRG